MVRLDYFYSFLAAAEVLKNPHTVGKYGNPPVARPFGELDQALSPDGTEGLVSNPVQSYPSSDSLLLATPSPRPDIPAAVVGTIAWCWDEFHRLDSIISEEIAELGVISLLQSKKKEGKQICGFDQALYACLIKRRRSRKLDEEGSHLEGETLKTAISRSHHKRALLWQALKSQLQLM